MRLFRIILSFVLLTTYAHASMLIIGHRGACGYEPENTLKSFQCAIDMGVDMIELDVYVCKTGELVVHHNDDVDRTTNGRGNIADMTFQQLRELKIRELNIDTTEKIPTLSEVIECVGRRMPINIELKGPGTARPIAQLIKKYLEYGWQKQDFVVSSFEHEKIREFKELLPDIKIGALFLDWNRCLDIVAVATEHKAAFIGLATKGITKKFIQKIHQAGFPVFVWTVNDKKSADSMRALGVDGIFSNYPDRVR